MILESVLLLATIILLLYSIKEGRGRKNLLSEVGKVTRMLTRQEYFLNVTDSMVEQLTKDGVRVINLTGGCHVKDRSGPSGGFCW